MMMNFLAKNPLRGVKLASFLSLLSFLFALGSKFDQAFVPLQVRFGLQMCIDVFFFNCKNSYRSLFHVIEHRILYIATYCSDSKLTSPIY